MPVELAPEQIALRNLINGTGGYSSTPIYQRLQGGNYIPPPMGGGNPTAPTGPGGMPQSPGSPTGPAQTQGYFLKPGQGAGVATIDQMAGMNPVAQQEQDVVNYMAANPAQFQTGPADFRPIQQVGPDGVFQMQSPAMFEADRNAMQAAFAQANPNGSQTSGYVMINGKPVSWNNVTRGYDDEGNVLSGSTQKSNFLQGPDFMDVTGPSGQVFQVAGNNVEQALQQGNATSIMQFSNPTLPGYVPMNEAPGMQDKLDPKAYNPDLVTLTPGQWALVISKDGATTAEELAAMGVEAYDPVTGQKYANGVPVGARAIIVKPAYNVLPGPPMNVGPAAAGFAAGAANADKTQPFWVDDPNPAYASTGGGYTYDPETGMVWSEKQNKWVTPDELRAQVGFTPGTAPATPPASGGGATPPATSTPDQSGLPQGYSRRADGKVDDGQGHYWDPGDGKWYNNDGSLYNGTIADPPPAAAPPAASTPPATSTPPASNPPAGGTIPPPASGGGLTSVDGGRYKDPAASPSSVADIKNHSSVVNLKPGQQSPFLTYKGTGELDPYLFEGYIVYYQPKGSSSKYRAKPGTVIYPGDKVSVEKLKPGHVFSYDIGMIVDGATGEPVEQYAYGGSTSADQLVVGDPQRPGEPNPELVKIDWDSRTVEVTPIKMAAYGGVFQFPNLLGDQPWTGNNNSAAPPPANPFNPPANPAQNVNPFQWGAGGNGFSMFNQYAGQNPQQQQQPNPQQPAQNPAPMGPGQQFIPSPINMSVERFSPAVAAAYFENRDMQYGLPPGTSASEYNYFRLQGMNRPIAQGI